MNINPIEKLIISDYSDSDVEVRMLARKLDEIIDTINQIIPELKRHSDLAHWDGWVGPKR